VTGVNKIESVEDFIPAMASGFSVLILAHYPLILKYVKIVSIILWSSVFGTLFNWIYKLTSYNYNPKVHLSIIGVQILILLYIL